MRLYTDVIKRVNREEASQGQRKDSFGMMGENKRKRVLEASRAAQNSLRRNLSNSVAALEGSVKEIERAKRREEIQKEREQRARQKKNEVIDHGAVPSSADEEAKDGMFKMLFG